MQLRVARHTERLDEVVAFYRDGLGLPEIGGFRDHGGYDGVFLDIPGTGAHLELTSGGAHRAPEPHPESLLVLYLADEEAVRATAARLGAEPVSPANPYWAEHGLTFEDPDGFRVVLVARVTIAWHAGDRTELRPLFELAEDSPPQLDAYIDEGRVLVAVDDEAVVGHLQLIEDELRSLAVVEDRQGEGIGRALVARAVEESRGAGVRTLRVATAAADIGNLRFYQRLGFRMLRVERDAFTPATGYPDDLDVDGIPLRDRIWLSRDL
jgi:GNAT superfamily N-acetyltransferase